MTAIAAHRRVARFTALLAALMLAAAIAVADAGAARAVDSFSISGHVTLPAGAPAIYMNAVNVHVERVSGGPFYQGNAAPSEVDGSYQISGLPAGTYRVAFQIGQYFDGASYPTPNLLSTTYNGHYDPDVYTPVDLTVGNQDAIDTTLEWGSTISGAVTLAADSPQIWATAIGVTAEGDNGTEFFTGVGALTGTYTFSNLPPGSYVLKFVNGQYFENGAWVWTDFVEEFYNNVYLPDAATPVVVPYHAAITGIDAGLSRYFHFTTAAVPTINAVSLKEGATLGSSTGTWSPAATFTYRWKRDGAPIAGAIKSQYTITAADIGKKLTLTVTGSRADYTSESKTSAAKYIPKVFAKTVMPTITGTAKAGYRLTAHRGTWYPAATYSYQWYRNGAKITGATGYTYKLTSTDTGKKIQVKVTGKRTGYTTVTRTSASKTIAW